jgi:hypothetical protein
MLPLRRLLASPALRLGGGIARMQCTKASRALRVAGHAVTEPTERLAPRKGERRDSIDERTLHDRAMHDLRMQRAPVDADIYKEIQRLSLGRFKGWHSQRLVNARRARAAKLLASAPAVLGRRGVLVEYDELSALNREALPEVALLGHANCGELDCSSNQCDAPPASASAASPQPEPEPEIEPEHGAGSCQASQRCSMLWVPSRPRRAGLRRCIHARAGPRT